MILSESNGKKIQSKRDFIMLRFTMFIATTSFLVGCGGGSSGNDNSVPNQNLSNLYFDETNLTGSMSTGLVILHQGQQLVVLETITDPSSGDIQFLGRSTNFQKAANPDGRNTLVFSELLEFISPNQSFQKSQSTDSKQVEFDATELTVSENGNDAFTYQAVTLDPASNTDTAPAGVYAYDQANFQADLTEPANYRAVVVIDNNDGLSITDSTGCTFTGKVAFGGTSADPRIQTFSFEGQRSQCSANDFDTAQELNSGTYTGLGYVIDNTELGIIGSNGPVSLAINASK